MPKPRTAKANPALRLAFIRQLHVYVSMFVAPSLMFFAITGAFQTFRIPDRKDAPVVLQKLARAHRDDVFALKPAPPPKKPAAGKAGEKPKAAAEKPKTKLGTTLVKWFFVLISIALVFSTGFGIWMALAYHRQKALLFAVLVIGAAIPILLLGL
jgi:uncharacterized membrane protein YcjF (UPF0283 family)